MLRAGVMQEGPVHESKTGTPQGGVASPLLANVNLHRIDRAWDERQQGRLVRYADDALVMCRSREQAEAALQRLRVLLAELGLEPKEAKTRIVHLQVGGEGLDFLGFHHRMVATRSRSTGKPLTFLARGPRTRRYGMPANGFGNSPTDAGCCWESRLSSQTGTRSCSAGLPTSGTATPLRVSARSGTTRGRGWRFSSANGINARGGSDGTWWRTPHRTIWAWSALLGSSSHPGLSRTGGARRMPAVNGVGEPCAGEPHARFEVAGAGNGARNQVMVAGVAQPTGKPR